jgi:hypothetical protein
MADVGNFTVLFTFLFGFDPAMRMFLGKSIRACKKKERKKMVTYPEGVRLTEE